MFIRAMPVWLKLADDWRDR